MNGGISISEDAEPEQVLLGEHNGTRILVLSVKPNPESAQACWAAACSMVEMEAFAGLSALIIDIRNAAVRHGFITEMT